MQREVSPIVYIDRRVFFDGKNRVYFGKQGDYIDVQRQRKMNDCGYTCLEMLGYNFPKEQKREDLWNYELSNFGGELVKDYKIDKDVPLMVLIETKQGNWHWVISIGKLIIDPNRGVMETSEYEKENIADVLGFYKVPYKKVFGLAAV
ncbi:MAG: hypothetical protein Q8P10_02055 [bacterium]|nr:hypothetical protein [bacterium]